MSSTECIHLAICTDYWHPFCAVVVRITTSRMDYQPKLKGEAFGMEEFVLDETAPTHAAWKLRRIPHPASDPPSSEHPCPPLQLESLCRGSYPKQIFVPLRTGTNVAKLRYGAIVLLLRTPPFRIPPPSRRRTGGMLRAPINTNIGQQSASRQGDAAAVCEVLT